MANGVYGQTIPSQITSSDVDIFYSYSESRSSDSTELTVFKRLPSTLLRTQTRQLEEGSDSVLEGMYKINLPLNEFNKKGFYTVYIKPREIKAKIKLVSQLSEFPDVTGIVIDSNDMTDSSNKTLLLTNNSLVGYRVVYFKSGSRMDYCRIITSNNKSEPIIKQLSGNKRVTAYRYNNSSELVFVTLTPSMSTSFAPTVQPYIGENNQDILLINTKFSPIMLDIELTEHDVETLTTMLEGSQVFNQDNGLVTTFNKNGEIYHQSQNFIVKNDYTGEPIKKVKQNMVNKIDFSEKIETLN